MWNPTTSRKTVPPLPTQQIVNAKPQRKTMLPVHKSNTIAIPVDPELTNSHNENKGNQTPNKTRNFFEGFRNTLRSKHKSDNNENPKENEQDDNHRRWAEANNTVNICFFVTSICFQITRSFWNDSF